MNPAKTGQLIADLRKEKGLNQIEFAKMLNISNRTVSKWENGDGFPDISLLPTIAEIFSITTDELLAGELKQSVKADEPKPLFVFRGKESYKVYCALLGAIEDRVIPRWLQILSIIFILVVFVFYMMTFGYSIKGLWAFLPIPFLLLFSRYIGAYFLMLNERQLNNAKGFEQITEVIDGQIIIKSPKKTQKISLSNIKRLWIKKDCYVLRAGKVYVAITKDDSIEGGSYEEFEKYLLSIAPPSATKRSVIAQILTVLYVIFIVVTTVLLILVAIFVYDPDTIHANNQAIESIVEMESYDICDTINLRTLDKISYDASGNIDLSDLNYNERMYYIADDFVNCWDEDGFEVYLMDHTVEAPELFEALNEVGLTDLARVYKKCLDDNNINPNNYNPDKISVDDGYDYAMHNTMAKKYFEYDKLTEALADYVKANKDAFK